MPTRPADREGRVASVSAGVTHGPYKPAQDSITLLEGLGVEGDAHLGRTVQHRSRARVHPDWVNLRQVHLLAAEFHEELSERGFTVGAGDMGENVLTRGIELLLLPAALFCALAPTPSSKSRGCATRAPSSTASSMGSWRPCSTAHRTGRWCGDRA